jgi:hypothetical protein
MARKLNNIDKTSQQTVASDTSELMRESLRKAEEIRRSLAGRKHSDSTILIADDRIDAIWAEEAERRMLEIATARCNRSTMNKS